MAAKKKSEAIVPVEEEFQGEHLLYIEKDGERWYVGVHVMEQLGYANPKQAIHDILKADEKEADGDRDILEFRERDNYLSKKISYSGQTREMLLFNQDGVNAILFRSKKPIGKRLRQIYSKFETERQKGNVIAITKDQAVALMATQDIMAEEIKELKGEVEEIKITGYLPYRARITNDDFYIIMEKVRRIANLRNVPAKVVWGDLHSRFMHPSFRDINYEENKEVNEVLDRWFEEALIEYQDSHS